MVDDVVSFSFFQGTCKECPYVFSDNISKHEDDIHVGSLHFIVALKIICHVD